MPFVSTALKIGAGILGGLQAADLFGIGGDERPVATRPQVLPGGAPALTLGPTPAQNGGAAACMIPFRASAGAALRATPQVHALVNPVTGKLDWFGPGKIRFIPRSTRRRRCRPR